MVAAVPNEDKLAELHTILAAAKLPTEVEKKIRGSVDSVFQPAAHASSDGKAGTVSSPAAQAAQSGPYQQASPNFKKTESEQTVAEDRK